MARAAHAVVLVAGLFAAGCGGSSLDARARESVERLPTDQQRAAGQVLVAYETAARAKDEATLCRTVLNHERSSAGCEATWRPLLDEQESIAIEVQRIDVRGAEATAHIKGTLLLDDGERRESAQTVRLVRTDEGWRLDLSD